MNQRKQPAAVRVGMAQMLVEFGRPVENMDRARDMIARAAATKCHIVVLPEALDLGWPYDIASGLAEPIPGPRGQMLAQSAAEHGLYVLAGLTERAGDAVYNAAVFFSPTGKLLHVHRKILTLKQVEGVYAVGDRLGVVPTPFGTIGIDICADSTYSATGHEVAKDNVNGDLSADNTGRNLAIPHALCHMGAGMILSPCAWAVPAHHDNAKDPYGQLWLTTYGTISRMYNTAFVGVSNVGQVTFGAWQGWRCIGCSLALDPAGNILAQGPYGGDAQTLLTVDFQARR